MKNIPEEINSRLNTTEENICEFEDITIETIQNETEKEKRLPQANKKKEQRKKKGQRASVNLRTTLSNSIPIKDDELIKSLPTKKTPHPGDFTCESYQTFKKKQYQFCINNLAILKKLNIYLPYDLVILFPIYPREKTAYFPINTCLQLFMVALLIKLETTYGLISR